MARHVSEATKHAAALQAARRMIARGERPGYRLRAGQDRSWTVDGLPWVTVATTGRRAALHAARATIAEWLDVELGSFDIES